MAGLLDPQLDSQLKSSRGIQLLLRQHWPHQRRALKLDHCYFSDLQQLD